MELLPFDHLINEFVHSEPQLGNQMMEFHETYSGHSCGGNIRCCFFFFLVENEL